MPPDESWTDETGATLGWRWSAVSAAGLYVPGGLAILPVLGPDERDPGAGGGCRAAGDLRADTGRGGEPAGAAGRAAVGGGHRLPHRRRAGDGGLAYGTETIAPVDKITGPGNAYVAAAKRRVFGKVGIDMIAGPSEILVIADADNDPDWIAVDLLSQAEHDESAQSILITDDAASARRGRGGRARLKRWSGAPSRGRPGATSARSSRCATCGEAARCRPDRARAPGAVRGRPRGAVRRITHAGAVFLGQWTPEAIGDYIGGPNHVLPTARSARFSSGLSVLDFMKRTTLAQMTPEALRAIGPAAETLAGPKALRRMGFRCARGSSD
jgi:histidinol dehydrogenase